MTATIHNDRVERRHIAALDGLRAVAIAAVLLFHHGFGWAKGGYLGVDLFFVLSGYLIAGKLLTEHSNHGRISLRNFWLGRFRRLLPALLAVLAAAAVYATVIAERQAQRAIRLDIFAALAYVANWRFILVDVGYFASNTAPSPVRHLWSLSVEEQFYLLFPLLMVALAKSKWWSQDRLIVPIGFLIAASTALTAWLASTGASTTRLYEGTDTRLATILVGAGAAVIQRRWEKPPAWLPSAYGAALAVLLALALVARGDNQWMYPTGQLVFAIASAVVILGAANLTSSAGVLKAPPVVLIGVLSYSLYLWHWPVFLVLTPARTGLDSGLIGDLGLFTVRVAVSFACALLSYRLLEEPIRSRRVRPANPALLSVCSMAAIVLLASLGTAGAPKGDELAARTGEQTSITVPSETGQAAAFELPPGATLPPPAPTNRPLRLTLLGDSGAYSIYHYRPKIANTELSGGAIVGCGIMWPASPYENEANPRCEDWQAKWIEALQNDPDIVVMMAGAWELNDHWINGRRLVPPSPEATKYLDGQLDRAVELISTNSDARIAVLELACAPPQPKGPDGQEPRRSDIKMVNWYNARLHSLATRYPGLVQVISISDHLCPNGKGVESYNGILLRDDGTHWNEQSAPIGWEWIMAEVQYAATRTS